MLLGRRTQRHDDVGHAELIALITSVYPRRLATVRSRYAAAPIPAQVLRLLERVVSPLRYFAGPEPGVTRPPKLTTVFIAIRKITRLQVSR